jgi:omega-6 fatty acid desaturase (delta-12 desaturase)
MWRELHNKHHTNQGRLKKRGISLDVWTLTVREYKSASKLKKWAYRLYRNPIVLFFVAPVILFIFIFRVPFEKFSLAAVINIIALNLIILCLYFLSPLSFLKWAYVLSPSLLISYFAASFLFYVQHQYEKTLWITEEQSDNVWISLRGSSYIEMSPFLAWCYGNINFHNIHHLDVKIPMYHLPEAFLELQKHIKLNSLSLLEALTSYRFKLWNPQSGKLEKFPDCR